MADKKKTKVYMAVTPDKYELPIVVVDKLDELSKIFGIPKRTISYSLCRGYKADTGDLRGRSRTVARFYTVYIDE